MNYFEEPSVDLFGGPPEAPAAPPAVNPDEARRLAQLASLATLGASDEAAGIFASMDAKTETYMTQIEQVGEQAVREQISADRQTAKLEALSGVLREHLPTGNPELTQGAVAAYTSLQARDAKEEAAYAMERQAVERVQSLAATGNTTQARLMLSNLENGNALDVIRDYNAKQLILEAALKRFQGVKEDQPWFRDLADFALSVVPAYSMSRVGNVDSEGLVKNWYDNIFAGKRYQREADALWDIQDMGEFSTFVNGDFLKNLHDNATMLGYTNNTEMVELMSGLVERTPSAFETNAWSAVDIGGFVPWTKAAKLAGGMTSTLVRAGARKEASEVVARAVMDALQEGGETAVTRSGMNTDQIARNLEVSAIAPEGTASRVPIADDAISAYQRGRAALDLQPELEARARLDGAELGKAISTIQQRLERQFQREIKNVKVLEVQLAGGSHTNRIEFVLGKKSGGGFVDEKQANRYGKSIGMDGEAIIDESGQWFFKTVEDVAETGFFTRLLNVKTPSPMRHALSARNVGDTRLADAAQVAGGARNKLLKTLGEPYEKTFRALTGDEHTALAQVLQAGETKAAWLSPSQLDQAYRNAFKRAPSQREVTAYQAARDINDMEFALRNDEIYRQRVIAGYKTVSFDTKRGAVELENAIIDRELKDMPKTRIFDVSTGKHYVGDSALTAQQWERMRGQGYQLVHLERPLKMADDTTIKTFLVKGQDLHVEPLKGDQVAYRAGGHRMYRGKYFVKQTVWGSQADTGVKFLESPNTYIAATTRGEAKFWASRMEAARLAHLEGAGLDTIDEILGGHAGLPDAEDFVRMMDDPAGAFQKDTKFDVYFDREMPDEYVSPGEVLDFIDPDDTGFNGFLRLQGRMYTGRKGERLPDYQGGLAPLLSPYETINRSLMNISALSSFGDYKIQAVERWMKTFRQLLDTRDMPEGLSDMRLFLEAPLHKGGNAARQRANEAALAQRQIIKRVLGWKTEADMAAEQWGRQVSEWVAGDELTGPVAKARRLASGVDWWQDVNPVSALRGFAFDLKLGMFNIAQLPMQLSTAVAATTLSPKMGMKGWAMIAPMRFVLGGRTLSKEALEARLDQLVKNGVHDLGGFSSSAEFKDFARSAMRSGFFDLGGTHGLLDSYGASTTMDGFASGVKRTREAGRFFFFEAERWNRIVAWRIAWDEARTKFPTIGGNPGPRSGMVRLYRGETSLKAGENIPDYIKQSDEYKETVDATGRWFTESQAEARHYTTKQGVGKGVTYIDVPKADLDKYRVSNNPAARKFSARPETEYFLPRNLADARQDVSTIQRGISPEFAEHLAGRAEEYSFNMSRESQAWWQKGLLSVPTQFWAYNARMLEAMTIGNFTPAQKLRLVAGQSLLYGSAGVPVAGAISSFVKGKNPEMVAMDDGALNLQGDMSNPFATLDRGLVDQFILSTTGVNAQVGARYGTGGWTTELVKNMFGMSAYGEVSAADMLGGATYNIMGKVGSDVFRPVIEYIAAESGDEGRPIRREALLQLATNISTVGNGLKAYLVFNYGTYKSGAGSTLVDGLPSRTAFAVALGVQPGEMDEISALATFFKDKSTATKEAAKVIRNYRTDMLNRPDQAATIADEVNAFVRLLPADIRMEALKRANGDVDPSLYTSFVDRLQKEQMEQERNGESN